MRKTLAASLITACAALTGCANARSSPQKEEPASAPSMVVTGKDGTRYIGPVMTISALEGLPYAMGSISGVAADGTVWAAGLGIPLSQIRGATLSLQKRPLSIGAGSLSVGNPDEPVLVDSGELSFKANAGGALEGTASTIPEIGSATFVGNFGFSCWVFPQSIGRMQNGQGSGPERIQDEKFASPFCQPFAGIK